MNLESEFDNGQEVYFLSTQRQMIIHGTIKSITMTAHDGNYYPSERYRVAYIDDEEGEDNFEDVPVNLIGETPEELLQKLTDNDCRPIGKAEK